MGATSFGFPSDLFPGEAAGSFFAGEEDKVVLGCLAGGTGGTCIHKNTDVYTGSFQTFFRVENGFTWSGTAVMCAAALRATTVPCRLIDDTFTLKAIFPTYLISIVWLQVLFTCFEGIRSSNLIGLGTEFCDRSRFFVFCLSALGNKGGGCFGNGGGSARITRSCILLVCKACLNTSCALEKHNKIYGNALLIGYYFVTAMFNIMTLLGSF